MSANLIRRVGRLVTNPVTIADERLAGRTLFSSQLACNITGAVGLPASVFLNAGLKVWEDWLCEVSTDRSRVVRFMGRVFGRNSSWPEDRPAA